MWHYDGSQNCTHRVDKEKSYIFKAFRRVIKSESTETIKRQREKIFTSLTDRNSNKGNTRCRSKKHPIRAVRSCSAILKTWFATCSQAFALSPIERWKNLEDGRELWKQLEGNEWKRKIRRVSVSEGLRNEKNLKYSEKLMWIRE